VTDRPARSLARSMGVLALAAFLLLAIAAGIIITAVLLARLVWLVA
jgi:hypothetical protein